MRKRVQFQSDKPSRTQQHAKDQCDVNKILKKYHATGHISHVRSSEGQSGDFSGYQDFRTNLTRVVQAQNAFNDLPSQLRKRFANDPANLIDFVANPENYDEAIKLGLVPPKPQEPNLDDKTTETAPLTSPQV